MTLSINAHCSITAVRRVVPAFATAHTSAAIGARALLSIASCRRPTIVAKMIHTQAGAASKVVDLNVVIPLAQLEVN